MTDVIVGPSVRLGKDVMIRISNNGDFWRYGALTCRFQKPDMNTIDARSACAALPPRTDTDAGSNITLNVLGNWTFQSCSLKVAVSDTCLPSMPYGTYEKQKTFNVREALKLSMKTFIPYASVSFNNRASISVDVRNTEDVLRYVVARCILKKPDGGGLTAKSDCTRIAPSSNSTLKPSFVADSVGEWAVDLCSVEESNSSSCTPSIVHATESNIGTILAIFDRTLSITSTSLVSQRLKVGDAASINVVIRNNGENRSSSFVNCTLTDPLGNTRSASASIQTILPGSTFTFRPSVGTDTEGTWVLNSCTAYRMIDFVNNEQSTTINKEFVVAAAPQCTTSSQCGGTVTSCECSDNICVQCPYGYDCRSGRCIEGQSCLGTSSSCYSDGSSCVSCPDDSVCSDSTCAPTNDQPLPTVPLFLIVLVSMAIITPVTIFIIYRMIVR